jgi:hypothetical protein
MEEERYKCEVDSCGWLAEGGEVWGGLLASVCAGDEIDGVGRHGLWMPNV